MRENVGDPLQSQNWELEVRDTYIGTREGSLQSITLAEGYTFVTITICARNHADTAQVITFEDLKVATNAGTTYLPVGQAYRQSEAFGWILPLFWVFGARNISDEFWYSPIQSYEMLPLEANESIGCNDTPRFKNFAYLFMLPSESVSEPISLHFFEQETTLLARTPYYITNDIFRLIRRIGRYFALTMIALYVILRYRKRKATTYS